MSDPCPVADCLPCQSDTNGNDSVAGQSVADTVRPYPPAELTPLRDGSLIPDIRLRGNPGQVPDSH